MRPRLQALRDLFARYRAVFAHAWRHRREMDPPVRLPHEARFLPATLALQETPVHPAPRVAMGLILLFALLALLWAVFGHVDVVATAAGKIVPDSRSKVVQPQETGTIHAIHVRDGQVVRSGEPLIELDATVARADVERLRSEFNAAVLDAGRSRALLAALEAGQPPGLAALRDVLPPDLEPPRLEAEQRLVGGTYAAYASALDQLDAEVARREAERRATLAVVEKLRQTLPIVEQRARDYRDLMERRFVSRHGYLELEQARIEQERDLAAQREKLAEIAASRLEAEHQKARLVAETRREWLDRQQAAQERAASLAQELLKAESRDRLMLLAAPVDGRVQQLAVHTQGGVVTPAQPLMVIVPLDNPLEVEALVPNKDIGFVHAGQAVEIKVETFPFTKYGTLAGEVVDVSSDAIQDEKLGLVFAARVRLARDTLLVEGRTVRLSPGMAVTVEVKTGKRRLIEYFLGPLLRYADESLRER
ncbi:HlyD family type I secretion periplasmic adaptor subunit [Pseudothauera rhizosphaerae]|uniref:Membrane fusion protein (MFP) family protein n=1 Tax=Pseudothauera rhizosphaerae TaxID=2565932 RepID=A0A4S4AX76_9RHOO|nr:HlyD family type I secretion periplasmic adaptor subunit [Pseudothauera rhizosphaerae]THF63212.1 HlyD family type I secretion periplasmic adaptor subunit [Pseudothauera rhizosphaerae]